MLDREFRYYLDHHKELAEKYSGKFLVIKGDRVIGAYDSHGAAYTNTLKTEEIGTFLIQHCLPGVESYSQTFHSQVIIHAHK